jgi:signal transduction histidine kinase
LSEPSPRSERVKVRNRGPQPRILVRPFSQFTTIIIKYSRTCTLELRLKRCDLIALLRQAVAVQQRRARERTIVLDIVPVEAVVPIIADAERITQVINSYLVNALSYSPIDKPVTVRLTVESALARVSVHDEGPDIPLEEQGRIWERFYYVKRITAHQQLDQRLGLGLYLCQPFIERHHGSVGVQSVPGHGAIFWFSLPVDASVG